MKPIAERLFDCHNAEVELEELLTDAGVTFGHLGWDEYDCSVEIYDVPPTDRLSVAAQKVIHASGFAKAYVNHSDKWETHYHFDPVGPFVESAGWRVSYPHKRGEGPTAGILVEKSVPSWPDEWFKQGYAKVIVP